MPEKSTTPDQAEFARRQIEAVNRRDMDALMSVCPPDGVYDTSPSGLGVFEGPRRFVPSSRSGGMPSRTFDSSWRRLWTLAAA